MDPFAHTFAGAALAASGLRRVTPLATAALLIGVNVPDVDVVMMFAGDYMDLAHRRGLTHGIPALVVLPFLVTALLLGWDRWVRRRLDPGAQAASLRGLLLVSAIAVISHPILDWLNNYGMRWLMPFDGRWSYGDALFIIDPVAWLGLGGVAFLTWSRQPAAIAAWAVFWAAASWLVLTSDLVPDTARWLWLAGLVLLLVLRFGGWRGATGASVMVRPAQLTLLVVGLYMLANVVANIPARAEVRAVLAAQGLQPVGEVMVAPVAANPFRGFVVATTPQGYVSGSWYWLGSPRFVPDERLIIPALQHPAAVVAAEAASARRFLSWARFPYAVVEPDSTGYQVRFGDARYPDRGPGAGPTVQVPGAP